MRLRQEYKKRGRPGTVPSGARERPSLVGGDLLSHGLAPQYHRRSGA